jgi:hypothetical protein
MFMAQVPAVLGPQICGKSPVLTGLEDENGQVPRDFYKPAKFITLPSLKNGIKIVFVSVSRQSLYVFKSSSVPEQISNASINQRIVQSNDA